MKLEVGGLIYITIFDGEILVGAVHYIDMVKKFVTVVLKVLYYGRSTFIIDGIDFGSLNEAGYQDDVHVRNITAHGDIHLDLVTACRRTRVKFNHLCYMRTWASSTKSDGWIFICSPRMFSVLGKINSHNITRIMSLLGLYCRMLCEHFDEEEIKSAARATKIRAEVWMKLLELKYFSIKS